MPRKFHRHPRLPSPTRQAKKRSYATGELCPPDRAPGRRSSTMSNPHPGLRHRRNALTPRPLAHPVLEPCKTRQRAGPTPRDERPPARAGHRPREPRPHAARTADRTVPRRTIPLIFGHLRDIAHVAIASFYGKRREGFTIESRRHDRMQVQANDRRSARFRRSMPSIGARIPDCRTPALPADNSTNPHAPRCNPTRLALHGAKALAPPPTAIQRGRKPATSRQT